MRLAHLVAGTCVVSSAGLGLFLGRQFGAIKAPQTTRTLQPGKELTAVFLGASWCGASTEKGFNGVLAATFDALRRKAAAHQARFATIGIALDWDIADGVKFLNSVGHFDEIGVGKNWLNGAYDRYVRQAHGVNGVPQVVVVIRDIVKRDSQMVIGEDSVLTSVVGTGDIRKWLAAGVPLDNRTWTAVLSSRDSQVLAARPQRESTFHASVSR